ncbi:hypothetical protein T11_13180 [Trichinella zimbabwensis]|uniref:PiggyBac transposable element-derived protein domain-containing protein n=1 Tax=Trichinella zimbabwensis TaxID=268475 RepID=A0A0V1GTR6_9BILA|nr:hypothetical protein T11_13180 [Trichinella zimbabwensis]
MHNDTQVSERKGSKPDIILHYNNTKGGVDNLDKMTSTYSCQRMTARWPLVVFYNMIDGIGIQRLRSLDRNTSNMECMTVA